MIPFKYNLRSLRVRRTVTLMTILGTGLVVWSSCILFGLVDGLSHSLQVSGDPLDLIVLREGATAETTSGFDATTAATIATLPGILRDVDGLSLSAPELVFIPVAERFDGRRSNLLVRGVSAASRRLRPRFTIVEGRDAVPGRGECLASRSIAGRFKDCRIGSKFKLDGREGFRVVGLFDAGGSPAESELWVDLGDLARVLSREGIVSCVQLRASSASDASNLRQILAKDQRFRLDAIPESDYFADHERSGQFLRVGGTLIAIVLAIGAMFAAANTMHAAVGARTREIGTLRAMGFSRRDVLLSFLSESLILCALGGAAGLLATLPMSVLTFSVRSSVTHAEMAIAFRIGPAVMTTAMLTTLAMGLLGGLAPAIRAVRINPAQAVRAL
jgi:putative ABC transport system permease protein